MVYKYIGKQKNDAILDKVVKLQLPLFPPYKKNAIQEKKKICTVKESCYQQNMSTYLRSSLAFVAHSIHEFFTSTDREHIYILQYAQLPQHKWKAELVT